MKAGKLLPVLCLLACQLPGEETFDLPAYPVEAGPPNALGLQPLGVDAELVATQAMAGEGLVEALKKSVSLRARHFLGGNNEPIVRFRAYGSQSIPTTRGLDFRINEIPFGWTDGYGYYGALPAFFIGSASAVADGGSILGAQSLGGVVSMAGRKVSGPTVGLTLGSDDTVAVHLLAPLLSRPDGRMTLQAGSEYSDGYRPYNSARRNAVWLEGSQNLSRDRRVWWHLLGIDHFYEVPGPLNPEQARTTPDSVSMGFVPGVNAGFNIPRDRPRRDLQLWQLAGGFEAMERSLPLQIETWVTLIEDRFLRPVGFGGEDASGYDGGARLRLAYQQSSYALLLESGFRMGRLQTVLHHNEFGQWGRRWTIHQHRASLYHLGAEGRKVISDRLMMGGLLQVRHQRSRAADEWDDPTHPGFQAVGAPLGPLPHVPFAYDDSETSPAGSLWLNYAIHRGHNLRLKASYSVELPVYADRRAVSGGSPNRGPLTVTATGLAPQVARSLELVHSARLDGFDTHLACYANFLKDEILRGRTEAGADRALNAPRTRHLGIEARVGTGIEGVSGQWRLEWTSWFTEARFRDHPIYGNGPIAGVPESEHRASLQWKSHDSEVSAYLDAGWIPEGIPVDNAGTLQSPGYALLDLGMQWNLNDQWQLRAACNNVLDRTHVSAVIVRERVAAPIQANFLPGSGRSWSLSVRRIW